MLHVLNLVDDVEVVPLVPLLDDDVTGSCVIHEQVLHHLRDLVLLDTSLIFGIQTSAANRLIGEVVQSWRRPLLGRLLALSHLRHYY